MKPSVRSTSSASSRVVGIPSTDELPERAHRPGDRGGPVVVPDDHLRDQRVVVRRDLRPVLDVRVDPNARTERRAEARRRGPARARSPATGPRR